MRVECEACRQLVVASFGIDGDAVRATCPACRHVMSVTRAREMPAVGPIAGPVVAPAAAPVATAIGAAIDPPISATLCPKCGASPGAGATACPACGLTVARMPAYAEARDGVVPEAVRAAWTRATAAWTTAARHDELLQLVATNDAYAWAAGRYRTRGSDDIARRQLDRLRRAAEATLLASATVRPEATARPYRATRRVLAVLIAMIAMGTLYAMVLRGHAPPSSAGSIPARPLTFERPLPPAPIK